LTVLFAPRAAFAQAPVASSHSIRGFIDVNFGIASSAAPATTFTFGSVKFQEPATFKAEYPVPSTGALFDIGGGVFFTDRLGIGVTSVGTADADEVGLVATVPHPLLFNRPGTGRAQTEPLMRTEGAVDVSLVLAVRTTKRSQLRVMFGPSFFRYKADMVYDLEYDQSSTVGTTVTNVISITDYTPQETTGSGTGFHIILNGDHFFTKVFGIGGTLRFSRATVHLESEPFSEAPQSIAVGGLQFGGGIRFRFGG
jgi:hypothetical protein